MKQNNFRISGFTLGMVAASILLAIAASEFAQRPKSLQVLASEVVISEEPQVEVIYPASVSVKSEVRDAFLERTGLGKFVASFSEPQKNLLVVRLERLNEEQMQRYYPHIPAEKLAAAQSQMRGLP